MHVQVPGAPLSVHLNVTGHIVSRFTKGANRDRGPLLFVCFYIIMWFVNVIVWGLLSMHSLLENPFGSHPCKFPLTGQAQDLVRTTAAMLHVRHPNTNRIFHPGV